MACGIALGLALVLQITPQHPLVALGFVVLGGVLLGGLGVVAGVFAEKFDQMAAITNFIVTPLAFLSGTFYSVEALPPVLRMISQVNPVFYLIDGLRYGMIGTSDGAPMLGFVICSGSALGICLLAWGMLRNGYRLKS